MQRKLVTIAGICVAALFAGALAVLAQGPKPSEPQTALGSGFTYQGELKQNNAPANGAFTLGFRLYDSLSGGSEVGSPITRTIVVTGGLFTTGLDFGPGVFDGSARWLGITLAGGGSELAPRQPLSAVPYALHAADAWSLNGNGGTNANDFLGTTDALTLTLGVSGSAVLRIVPAYDIFGNYSPDVIGGFAGNRIAPGVAGATIAGGGASGISNTVSGDDGAIGGGFGNSAGFFATVGGGNQNHANGNGATVGGGVGDQAPGDNATIGGGNQNFASQLAATVGGGSENGADGIFAAVGGGFRNIASGYEATVGGGFSNTASYTGTLIGGGNSNHASAPYATVGGGEFDGATAFAATVAGGIANSADGAQATVSGGNNNHASGNWATVPGGVLNVASGANSFAAGVRAKAVYTGTFVWADSTNADFDATGVNQFLIRASGFVGINTNNPTRDLTISSSSSFVTGIDLYNTTTPTGTIGYRLQVNGSAVTDPGNLELWSTQRLMTIQPTGNIGIGGVASPSDLLTLPNIAGPAGQGLANAWNTYSSRRWKSDINTLSGALDKVERLRGVSFRWTSNGKPDIGLVAEEVGAVVPEVVTYEANGTDAQSVDYTRLVALLVEAIKEQQRQIDRQQQAIAALQQAPAAPPSELQTQNAALQQRVDSLETRLTALEQARGAAQPGEASVPLSWLLGGGLVVLGALAVRRRA